MSNQNSVYLRRWEMLRALALMAQMSILSAFNNPKAEISESGNIAYGNKHVQPVSQLSFHCIRR